MVSSVPTVTEIMIVLVNGSSPPNMKVMFWREIHLLKPDSIYKDKLINASREVITVHCKNMKPINTVYWQNVVPFVLQ